MKNHPLEKQLIDIEKSLPMENRKVVNDEKFKTSIDAFNSQIKVMSTLYNNICSYIRSQVENCANPKEVIQTINRSIALYELAMKNKNFLLAIGIYHSLDPISYVTFTEFTEFKKNASALFQVNNNFSNLRKLCQETNMAFIPPTMLITKDLEKFIENIGTKSFDTTILEILTKDYHTKQMTLKPVKLLWDTRNFVNFIFKTPAAPKWFIAIKLENSSGYDVFGDTPQELWDQLSFETRREELNSTLDLLAVK